MRQAPVFASALLIALVRTVDTVAALATPCRPYRPRAALFGALFFLCASTAVSAAPTRIVFVPSAGASGYDQLAVVVRASVVAKPGAGIEIFSKPLNQFRAGDVFTSPPALIVTVGIDAARQVAEINPPAPILHTMLPRAEALQILRNGRKGKTTVHRDSAIFSDQPIGRQLDLLRLALPRHRRLAVILGPATENEEAELRAAARERALTLEVATIKQPDALLPTLENLLDRNDVLLSVPEPLAYRSETIHHVMLTTFRYRVPVLGLSKAYVEAGALLAVYSTLDQIGQQLTQLLPSLTAAKSVSLPAPGYPKYFTISINRRVAASLELPLESENTLQRKLEELSSRKK